jgi:hypothetical protein
MGALAKIIDFHPPPPRDFGANGLRSVEKKENLHYHITSFDSSIGKSGKEI